MAAQGRQNMAGVAAFRFLALDTQSIPFPDAHFEVVIANHMLYHVPDLRQAVGELRRVLQPGGRLFAATNGISSMQKLFDLVYEFDPRAQKADDFQKRFCLENAVEVLGQAFEHVKIIPFESRLEVTEVSPLMDYILSMSSFWGIIDHSPANQARLEQFLAEKMAAEGKIVIPKAGGLAIAE
jgi:SAM-dependent methyltransferase